MVGKVVDFNKFWVKAVDADKSYNGFEYHSCCDSWSTRCPKSKRSTHKNHLPWRKLMTLLDKNTEDKKQALLGKMTEEGWKLPIVLNQICQVHSAPTLPAQLSLRLHSRFPQPQDFPPSLAPREFTQTDPNQLSHNRLCMF